MTREQLVAQALVAWLGQTLSRAADAAREALPPMDVEHFLRELTALRDFRSDEFSIALAGFGLGETRLRELAEAAGLRLPAVTDDLLVAAAWRNDRSHHPRILAFASGLHPGVSTLRHFDEPRSHDLARALLDWAKDDSGLCANAVQRSLLQVLGAESLNHLLSNQWYASSPLGASSESMMPTTLRAVRCLTLVCLLIRNSLPRPIGSKRVSRRIVR